MSNCITAIPFSNDFFPHILVKYAENRYSIALFYRFRACILLDTSSIKQPLFVAQNSTINHQPSTINHQQATVPK
jgi:hypothetical protein